MSLADGVAREKEYGWKNQIDKINQCKQRQDSLNDQMKDLYEVANKLGFYDAADYIRNVFIK